MIPNFIKAPNPSIYMTGSYLVIDVETTNINKGSAISKDNRLLYTSIYQPDKGWTKLKGNEHDLSNLLDLIYSVDFIVAHNAKFELQWLVRAGLDLQRVLIYDTMIGDYVIGANRGWRLALDTMAKRYKVGYKDKYISLCIKGGVCPSELPFNLLAKYCDKDVEVTHKIFLQQRKELYQKGLLPVFFTRCIFTPVVADMEMYGLKLDKELVQSIHKESVDEYNRISEELDKITGGINMASPQQVADFTYNKLKFKEINNRYGKPIRGKPNKFFPKGMPKTDEKTINVLDARTKKQKRFIELKKLDSKLRKKISSYTTTFMEACDNNDSMVYGKINQTITMTQRLSSSKPNLQNIDRGLKKVITSRHKGWGIRQNDYDQLEFRVAGFLAQDTVLFNDVSQKDFDAHANAATELFQKEFTDELDKVKKKEVRFLAKRHTFKPLYGGHSGTEKEIAYYDWFLDRYKGIKQWHDKILEEAMGTSELRTITGLVFYFPNTEYTHSGYLLNSTNIKNYPVQMFATADIATIGTTMLWHFMKDAGLKSFIINEVHDSVVIEEHPEEHEQLKELSDVAMCDHVIGYLKEVFGIEYNFPLTIDQEVYTNWGWDK